MKKLTEILTELYHSPTDYTPERFAVKEWIKQFRENQSSNTFANIGYQQALTDLLNSI